MQFTLPFDLFVAFSLLDELQRMSFSAT